MKQTEEEEFFKNLISQSKLKLPETDFEDQVMMHIQTENYSQQQTIPNEIKLSWVLITLVIILGTSTSLLLGQLQTLFLDIPSDMVKTVFDFVLILFVLMQLDSLIKITFRRNNIDLANQLREIKSGNLWN